MDAKAWHWRQRMIAEQANSSRSWAVTLTFNNASLTKTAQRKRADRIMFGQVQKWLRSIRKVTGKTVRFCCTTEYGPLKGRLHYHVLVHGDFQKRELERWRHGFFRVKLAGEASAAYVAKYASKAGGRVRASVRYGEKAEVAIEERAKSNPEVAAVFAAFPQARIVTVRKGSTLRIRPKEKAMRDSLKSPWHPRVAAFLEKYPDDREVRRPAAGYLIGSHSIAHVEAAASRAEKRRRKTETLTTATRPHLAQLERLTASSGLGGSAARPEGLSVKPILDGTHVPERSDKERGTQRDA